jgi:hypothetical protein
VEQWICLSELGKRSRSLEEPATLYTTLLKESGDLFLHESTLGRLLNDVFSQFSRVAEEGLLNELDAICPRLNTFIAPDIQQTGKL